MACIACINGIKSSFFLNEMFKSPAFYKLASPIMILLRYIYNIFVQLWEKSPLTMSKLIIWHRDFFSTMLVHIQKHICYISGYFLKINFFSLIMKDWMFGLPFLQFHIFTYFSKLHECWLQWCHYSLLIAFHTFWSCRKVIYLVSKKKNSWKLWRYFHQL